MDIILECTICMEQYNAVDKIPRMLRCGHTFCTKCLKELTRVNNAMNFPHIKCPIDKQMGHMDTHVEDIPINRLVLDAVDQSLLNFDKLSLKEENKNETMQYVNSAYDKLKKLEGNFSNNYNTIRDNILHFMNAKNSCMSEISGHFDKIISFVVDAKEETMFHVERFSKDKLSHYDYVLRLIEDKRKGAKGEIDKLESFRKQKLKLQVPLSDELSLVNELQIERLEDAKVLKEIDSVIHEMKGEYLPRLLIKNECKQLKLILDDKHLEELMNSVHVILPKKAESFELLKLNEELENMSMDSDFFWFQQNTTNVFKLNLDESNWLLVENKDNFVLSEMFRVTPLGKEEALITGGVSGFVCSNSTFQYKKGNFRRKQNMFNERRTHGSCKVGDFVYVCGGMNTNGDALTSCEKFSVEYEKWYKMANMNLGKSHLSLCNLNNEYLFSFGGENKFDSLLDVIERYTISVDIWEIMPIKFPFKIECVACLQTTKNEIMVFGGYSCEYGPMKCVYVYDLDTQTMKKLNNELPQPGWSIYHPIKQGNIVNLFYGGEDNFPPHHVTYKI